MSSLHPPHFPPNFIIFLCVCYTAQLARCQGLFDTGAQEVYIHGLGAAVNRAMNLALLLKCRSLGSLELSPNTSTVEVTDDLEECVTMIKKARKEKRATSIGYHGNVVDLW